MVNKVLLIGNLGNDPEIRTFENGSKVARFSVATSENFKDQSGEWQERTEWHNVVVWNALAERAEETLKKGMTVWVEGKLTHRSWEDQDGNKRYATDVVANYFRIIRKPESNNGKSEAPQPEQKNHGAQRTGQTSRQEQPSGHFAGTQPGPMGSSADDDLPF